MAAQQRAAPPRANRKKKIPETDRADITGSELLSIIRGVDSSLAEVSEEDAAVIAAAINANAYWNINAHLFKAEREKVFDAAKTLLNFLDQTGYPMISQLVELHTTLDAAIPYLPGGKDPMGEPYWPAALHIHPYSCWICMRSGHEAGTSRSSFAVRLTAAILSRLDYAVNAPGLEAFFQRNNVKAAFKNIRADLQR